jgi:hypothetical protein
MEYCPFLAQIAMKSPQELLLFFLDRKERPTEVPFMA